MRYSNRLGCSGSVVALVMAGLALAPATATAQTISQPTPPEYYSVDERGVDLVTGEFNYVATDVAIGPPGSGGLVRARGAFSSGWRDAVQGSLSINGSTYIVTLGLESAIFTFDGTTYIPASNVGATLTRSGDIFTYTTANGAVGRFSTQYCATSTGQLCTNAATLYEMVMPNGEQTNYNYSSIQYLRSIDPNGNPVFGTIIRLEGVTNNRGYRLQFAYQSNTMSGGGSLNAKIGAYLNVTDVTGLNQKDETCSANACAITQTWPKASYATDANGNETVTDQSNRQTLYSRNGALITGVRFPGSATDDISISYDGTGKVSAVTDATGSWNYAFVDQNNLRTTTLSGPEGQQTTVVTDMTVGRPFTVTVRTTASTTSTWFYSYDSQKRLLSVIQPESNRTELVYDLRGNVTRTTQVSRSGPEEIITSATYPATCTNVRTCNQPTSTTDPRGNVTDYAYDAGHGGLTVVTEPAPTTGAARPQTRIAYSPQFAFYKDSAGVITQAATAITLPWEVSTCAVGSSCIGGPEEIRTIMAYGQTWVGNNLLPTATTTSAGNGADTTTTTLTYTSDGDVETVDGPLTNQPDVTRYIYDDARQMVGMIGPDPDGGGALLNRAIRMTYNPDATISQSEVGTTNGQAANALSTFNSLQQVQTVYDAYQRPTQSSFTAAGTLYSVNQVFYDASGRPFCQVQRMNPASFLDAPSCGLNTTGGFGPDRITVTAYDLASRPVTVTSGFSTADALTETTTYTPNGLPDLLTDGNGNISALRYDGFDRPFRNFYPNATGGGVNNNDYTETLYDAASNVVSSRTRSGQIFTTTFDALNRSVSVNAPAAIPGQVAADSVAYTYDNLGRPLSASIPGGAVTTMTWDVLSRQTSEGGPLGTMSMSYDPAGRRTRLTWPDGFFVNYGYDPTGAMTAITQGAAGSVISLYAYDDLGRRIYVSRGNGVPTSYAYDPASRLTALNHDLAGTGADQSYGYGYNPSAQITQLSMSNSSYAYTGQTNGILGYGINGLNQTTSVNGSGLTYDANGNLTGDTTRTFAYDAANRLRSTTTNNATLSYDALGRLRQLVGTSGAQYIYDGAEITGAYNTGSTTISARLIKGPWHDELVVAYAGTDASSPQWSLQDHLGSTIAITSPTGGANFINRYDDYGQPQSGNAGRLQYTGQLWLPDFGLYHYKARAYHPGLGRFVQTDPIGYAAGVNLYAYVTGDAVNFADPDGLQQIRRPATNRGSGRYTSNGYRPPIDLNDVLRISPNANFPQSVGNSNRTNQNLQNFRDAHLSIFRIFGRGNLDGSRTSRIDDSSGALNQRLQYSMSNLTRERPTRDGNQYSTSGGYDGANSLFRVFTGRSISGSVDTARVQIDARTVAFVNFHYSSGQGGGQRFSNAPTISVEVRQYVTGSRIPAVFRFKIRYTPNSH